MKNQITKKQHFLPRFYLRNFTNSEGRLICLKRNTDEIFQCKPKNICKDKFLYETPDENGQGYILLNDIENKFSHDESYYNKLLNLLLSENCNLQENRDQINDFVSTLLLRNPKTFPGDGINGFPSDFLNKEAVWNCKLLLEDLGMNISIISIIKHTFKEIRLDKEFNGGYNIPTLLANALSSIYVVLLVSKDFKFLTCDLPVLFEFDDLGNAINNLFLPISPHHGLLFSNHDSLKSYNNKYREVSNSTVNRINQFYFKGEANRYSIIISQDENTIHRYKTKEGYM